MVITPSIKNDESCSFLKKIFSDLKCIEGKITSLNIHFNDFEVKELTLSINNVKLLTESFEASTEILDECKEILKNFPEESDENLNILMPTSIEKCLEKCTSIFRIIISKEKYFFIKKNVEVLDRFIQQYQTQMNEINEITISLVQKLDLKKEKVKFLNTLVLEDFFNIYNSKEILSKFKKAPLIQQKVPYDFSPIESITDFFDTSRTIYATILKLNKPENIDSFKEQFHYLEKQIHIFEKYMNTMLDREAEDGLFSNNFIVIWREISSNLTNLKRHKKKIVRFQQKMQLFYYNNIDNEKINVSKFEQLKKQWTLRFELNQIITEKFAQEINAEKDVLSKFMEENLTLNNQVPMLKYSFSYEHNLLSNYIKEIINDRRSNPDAPINEKAFCHAFQQIILLENYLEDVQFIQRLFPSEIKKIDCLFNEITTMLNEIDFTSIQILNVTNKEIELIKNKVDRFRNEDLPRYINCTIYNHLASDNDFKTKIDKRLKKLVQFKNNVNANLQNLSHFGQDLKNVLSDIDNIELIYNEIVTFHWEGKPSSDNVLNSIDLEKSLFKSTKERNINLAFYEHYIAMPIPMKMNYIEFLLMCAGSGFSISQIKDPRQFRTMDFHEVLARKFFILVGINKRPHEKFIVETDKLIEEIVNYLKVETSKKEIFLKKLRNRIDEYKRLGNSEPNNILNQPSITIIQIWEAAYERLQQFSPEF